MSRVVALFLALAVIGCGTQEVEIGGDLALPDPVVFLESGKKICVATEYVSGCSEVEIRGGDQKFVGITWSYGLRLGERVTRAGYEYACGSIDWKPGVYRYTYAGLHCGNRSCPNGVCYANYGALDSVTQQTEKLFKIAPRGRSHIQLDWYDESRDCVLAGQSGTTLNSRIDSTGGTGVGNSQGYDADTPNCK